DIDSVDAGETFIRLKTGGVVAVTRNHAAGGDEGHVAGKKESSRPARKLHDQFVTAVDDSPQLTIAAVIDPEFGPPLPDGMRAREASAVDLARRAGKD